MSAVKRLIEDIMELWESGKPVAEIAESLRIDMEMVQHVVEEYSDFFE
jgi:orotate phosphoribosyltransferase-like protein